MPKYWSTRCSHKWRKFEYDCKPHEKRTELNWMDAEYTHIKFGNIRNADHAHKMRWRCMDLAVGALKEATQ